MMVLREMGICKERKVVEQPKGKKLRASTPTGCKGFYGRDGLLALGGWMGFPHVEMGG